MNWKEIEPRAVEVKKSLTQIMDKIAGHQQEWGLPELPMNFVTSRELLNKTDVNIVICGEVKRGKSTFINALIGQDLLPTGVRETTSQVFRISHADEESFALVFENGHKESITRDQLARYGSQTVADLEGEPLFAGRTLKWIEANVPATFLPEGVHIVDTPGIGALYSGHSIITNRYIPEADAVVFVLDSNQELMAPEKEFLEKVYEQTKDVFYIQTKIDTRGEAEWMTVKEKSEKLLNDTFGKGQNSDITVYPVSSKMLFEAANESDEIEREYMVEDCLFDEARNALNKLIYRIVGWTRSSWAMMEASKYHGQGMKNLIDRQSLLDSDGSEQKKIQAQKQQMQQEYNQNWGQNGVKRQELVNKIREISRGMKVKANQDLSANGLVCRKFRKKLKDCDDSSKLENMVSTLGNDYCAAITKSWESITFNAQEILKSELNNFSIEFCNSVNLTDDNALTSVVEDITVFEKVVEPLRNGMMGAGAGYFLVSSATQLGLAGLCPPAALVAGVAAIWSIAHGGKKKREAMLSKEKAKAIDYLQNLADQCAQNLLNFSEIQFKSHVDSYVESFVKSGMNSINEACSKYESELREQLKLLGESEVEKKRLKVVIEQRVGDWKNISSQISTQMKELKVLNRELS